MTFYPDIRLRKCTDPAAKLDWFEVCEDCSFSWGELQTVIPKGFITDFASVPRWLWSILPPHGKMANAAILHDYLYDYRIGETQLGAQKARLLADLQFVFNCRQVGVGSLQVWVVFAVLRVFGGRWWVE